jgi:glycosyltransferase involved in cell wall biosynthesis
MASRKRVGLIFNFDESWTGGLYYLLNIVHALCKLPDEEKPVLVIFFKDDVRQKLQATQYPYLEFLPLQKPATLAERIYRKFRRLLNKQYRYYPQYPATIVDFVFPCVSASYIYSGSLMHVRKVFWIADFQHKHLPHFFSKEEILGRDKNFQDMTAAPVKLVVSSNDAKADLCKFYPEHKTEVAVMQFATTLPTYKHLDIASLRAKYNLVGPYFFSPNQFWAHKNHIVILQAVVHLKEKGYIYQVAFTGNEHDYRNPGYADSLKQYVRDNKIEQQVKFLGFIDRSEQLQLMNHSLAVIQPSLFEGWSTVVEDAKAMDQVLIVSDLNVHKEQCVDKAFYFNPKDAVQLASIMEAIILKRPAPSSFVYTDQVVMYAHQILNL